MLFKMLHQDVSNIPLDVTSLHVYWRYMAHMGEFLC
jgi:hypothetical protein